MKTYNSIILLCTLLLTISCNNESHKNNNKEPTVQNGYLIQYFSNGHLKSKNAVTGKKLFDGPSETYYENEQRETKGQWKNGKKEGWFKYYDSLGHVDKVIDFINYHDSSVSRPNQVIIFDSNGDTILNRSHFYRFYSIKDTIKLHSEDYYFKIVFGGGYFKYTYVVFGDFDELYRLPPGKKCLFSEMKNSEIELSPQKYKLGENIIRGYILNTASPVDDIGNLTGEAIQTFFNYKFYVVP